MSDSIGNGLIIMLAHMKDEDRTNELLARIGDGGVTTVEGAGAALELYCMGTDTTLEEAVDQLRDIKRDGPNELAWKWLQDNHPELF